MRFQLEALSDQLSEWLPGAIFAMGENDARPNLRDRFQPMEQVGLPRMGAETTQGVDGGVDRDLLAKDLCLALAIHQHPAQRALGLEADDDHRGFRLPEIVL